ncbi:cupredoxin domain-containing protein [Gottfriedia sp. OAE603]|uniref:cupredoxin domain-containing protein n=1 Tax=Gottfriedia sp. OAE603 TaxID=2663872 RepID=UPI001789D2CA
MHFVVIKKKWLLFSFVFIVIGLSALYYLFPKTVETTAKEKPLETVEIHMVTGEFSTKLNNGSEIEAYRWDPGTINVEENQRVVLKLHGINGMEHHFHIEGTNVSGVVKKGETTEVAVQFKKEGTYRLVCDTHSTTEDSAPMIAYIVVD